LFIGRLLDPICDRISQQLSVKMVPLCRNDSRRAVLMLKLAIFIGSAKNKRMNFDDRIAPSVDS
jgi:hypothetical protein